ncbi:hypothetical protein [Amycolatopsis decaplanina]|nr:hypothetical protein [Amycolatopsis decaplanina]
MTVRLFFGRPRPGTVGESRRVVYVFAVPDTDTVRSYVDRRRYWRLERL